jgi:hypothetical protein
MLRIDMKPSSTKRHKLPEDSCLRFAQTCPLFVLGPYADLSYLAAHPATVRWNVFEPKATGERGQA